MFKTYLGTMAAMWLWMSMHFYDGTGEYFSLDMVSLFYAIIGGFCAGGLFYDEESEK